jgi:hypothetical protein
MGLRRIIPCCGRIYHWVKLDDPSVARQVGRITLPTFAMAQPPELGGGFPAALTLSARGEAFNYPAAAVKIRNE